MLEVLKENTEVEYNNRPGICVLAGTFNQIKAARKLLQHLIQMHVEKRPERTKHNSGVVCLWPTPHLE